MDYASCYVIYVDKTARGDRLVKKDTTPSTAVSRSSNASSYFDTVGETEEVQANLQAILAVFNEVFICTTGSACSIKLAQLSGSTSPDLMPIIVLVTVSSDDRLDARIDRTSRDLRTPSPSTVRQDPIDAFMAEDISGIRLLHNIAVDIQNDTSTKLIVPIAVFNLADGGNRASFSSIQSASISGAWLASSESTASGSHELLVARRLAIEPSQLLRCLDAGAADVLIAPLQPDRVFGLTTHAYRARKEAKKERSTFLATRRMRKRSWVGIDEEKPYAYLRESMVSGLMHGICKPESVVDNSGNGELHIIEQRQAIVAEAVGSWEFSAHDFSDDELQYAAFLMLEHALRMPQLEKWRLSTGDLQSFLAASRAAYNDFVVYHNFRHVVDVLQAVFTFLVRLGTLPPYPADRQPAQPATAPSAIATLLTPFDALTLLISAIGHDVGHPGVNNAFLVSLNSPLAQLYNDRSVLEAFHCAAYSQILRRYWKAAFEDSGMRKLLINSILATDMGVHFKYMSDLGNLQQKLHDNDNSTDGWSPQILDEYRTLACGLLIKCADISNVARKYDVAAQWADILTLEFAKQGEMEKDVGIPTTLFGGPPELGSLVKLANSQIGFMNIFARPLFEAVTDIFPTMQFTVDEILANQAVWETKIQQEKQKERKGHRGSTRLAPAEGFRSPRSRSPLAQSQEREPSQESAPTITRSPTTSTAVPASHEPATIPPGCQATSQDMAIRPALGTPPQSPNQSRRPSLGSPFNYAATGPSPDMTSRRSSSAFPSANIIPTSQTRRSSNAMPSQLQLGIDPSFPPASAENIQPTAKPGDIQPSRTLDLGPAPILFNGNGRARPGGGRGNGGRSSSVDTSPTKRQSHRRQSTRHSNHPSSTRFSVPSSHDRHSLATSGAHTSLSFTHPCSPSTQATSFLTVDSDENDKSYDSDRDPDRPLSSGVPSLLDLDQGGRPAAEDAKNTGVMTTVLSGDWGRTLSKRPSRFRLDFWKKRGRAQEASP